MKLIKLLFLHRLSASPEVTEVSPLFGEACVPSNWLLSTASKPLERTEQVVWCPCGEHVRYTEI